MINNILKRIFDFILAFIFLFVLIIPIFLICCLIKITSKGPILHWSKRIGKKNKIFLMPKFRTMKIGTPQMATHLMTDSQKYLTPIGKYLRLTSLDEIPQLWSILRGEMSFVGPRPALFNQDDLVNLRTLKGVHLLTPGLTGLAQINGRDEIPIPQKVEWDFLYLQQKSFLMDIKILFKTFIKVLRRDNIQH